MAFKLISVSKKELFDTLNRIETDRKQSIMDYLALQRKTPGFQESGTVFSEAIEQIKNRITRHQQSEYRQRLDEHLFNLEELERIFSQNKEIRLIGLYGWGEACKIKAPPFSGTSQYDSIVYEIRGKIYIEQIGSCWQIHDLEQKKNVRNTHQFKDVKKPKNLVMTVFGRLYRVGQTFAVHYLERLPDGYRKSIAESHHHHRHSNTEPVPICICGRFIGPALSGGGGAVNPHGGESAFQHNLAQNRGSDAFEPSELGLTASCFFLPIKIVIDFFQIRKIPGLVRAYKYFRSMNKQAEIPAVSTYHRDQKNLIKSTLFGLPYKYGVFSPIFYVSAIGNIVGQSLGLATAGAMGAAVVGLSSIGFAVLGILVAIEGIAELWKLMNLKRFKTIDFGELGNQLSGETKLDYKASLAEAKKKEMRKSGLKVLGGSLITVGTFVPGAQPAIVVGVIILLALPAVEALKFLSSKLWSSHRHFHLDNTDLLDPGCRLCSFDRLKIEKSSEDSLTDDLGVSNLTESAILSRIQRNLLEKSIVALSDAKRKHTYLIDQKSSTQELPESASKNLDALLENLAVQIKKHERIIRVLNSEPNRAQLLAMIEEAGEFEKWVAPKSRGFLKRLWKRSSIAERVKAGIIRETEHSNFWHRHYQLSTKDPEVLWSHLTKNGIAGAQKKIQKASHVASHEIAHRLAHLCDYENNIRKLK